MAAPSHRLFVALEPDDAVRAAVAAAQHALRTAAGPAAGEVRWTAPETAHLTVRFLGDVADARVEAVASAVAGAAVEARPLALALGGPGAFPSARRPRVLWLALGGEVAPLQALAAALERRLAALGFPAEARPLTPHLTIGRARSPRGAPGLAPALAARLALPEAAEPVVPWPVRELLLFESHLGPGGARHEVLRRAPLRGG